MKKLLTCIALTTLLFSCKKEQNKITPINIKINEIKENTIVPKKAIPEPEYTVLEEEIDVKNIFKQVHNLTSGFIPKEGVKNYDLTKKNKYFVHYFLLNEFGKGVEGKELLGQLTVYDTVDPYYQGSGVEDHIDLILYDSTVKLYNNKIHVGIHYNTLIENFGKEYEVIDSILVFKHKDKTAMFTIRDSIVTNLRIGYFNNEADIKELIKQNKPKW